MRRSSCWAAAGVVRGITTIAANAADTADHRYFITDMAFSLDGRDGSLVGASRGALRQHFRAVTGTGQPGEDRDSAGEAVVVEIGSLFGRGLASENGIAVGEA